MKREKIRLPKIKGKFRLLLYLVTLVFCALSVAETMFGYFPFAIEIAVYVIAAVTLTAACFYLAGDLKRGIREVVRTAWNIIGILHFSKYHEVWYHTV